ncbi:MAG TPA: carboxypeptidase regulatory-like domain-containing protein [Polyangiaceae bacterium]|nr:carboxypeptidase regulatory-like domain-containing protein [Polyangiaceae bacterium]
MHRFAPLLALALLAASEASAVPEARVRVRGSARLQATVTHAELGTELRGTLGDDTGRPVPSVPIRVRWTSPTGEVLPLPPHEACARAPSAREPRPFDGSTDVLLVDTDGAGRFCVRWPDDLGGGRLTLTYADDRELLEPAQAVIDVDRAPSIELAFVPPPTTLSADRERALLQVEARARRSSIPRRRLPLVVSFKPEGAPETLLARTSITPGELLRVPFAPRDLGQPGAGELRAAIESESPPVRASARTLVTATAMLEAPSGVTADSEGNAALEVQVVSALGAVHSGSIEALALGRTVGIAPVQAGRATLRLALGPGERSVAVTLRYLPSAPWWLPGPDHALAARVEGVSPLRHLPWAAALLALGAWILAGWRRPPRAERSRETRPPPRPTRRPSLQWTPEASRSAGWSGTVIDAHDGGAIAGAQVRIAGGGKEWSATTDGRGEFTIDAAPTDASLTVAVHAPWHSELERPLPPPGRLVIALVTRRRALLARFVDWAERWRAPGDGTRREPTPGEIARAASNGNHDGVATWATAVEAAAFGPEPVDREREAAVRSLEPP